MPTANDPIKQLSEFLAELPGIGPKAAERIVFHLLKKPAAQLESLASSISRLRVSVKTCERCGNVTNQNPCRFCLDPKREQSMICVVADPQDISVIEKAGEYRGQYHVLGGVINTVEHITPDQLSIKQLLGRLTKEPGKIKEVIIATNADLEGETTALYLARSIKPLGIKVTRLARGLPVGSTIEYADEVTISSALKGRQTL